MALGSLCGYSRFPGWGGGSGIVLGPWGRTVLRVGEAGRGPGLTVTEVEGSHVHGSV